MDYALSRQQGPRTKRGLATTIWGLVFVLLLAAPAVHAADWYASPSGAGTQDCMSAANACAGIQAAIDKADEYDTVHVLAGNYATTSQRIRIEKEGLQLIGAHSPFAKPYATPPGAGEVAHGSADNKAANASVLQAAGGAPSSVGGIKVDGMIWVRNVKSVRIENLYFELKTSGGFFGFGGYGKEAIVATGYVNGLEIVNNYIKATSGTAGIAIGINVAGTSDSSVPASETRRGAQFVTISGNVIEPSSSAAPKRAIAMESNVGLIENNQVAAHTQDMWIQNPAANNTTPAAQRNLTFQGNWFFGRMQLYLGRASGVTAPVVVSGNHFIKPGSVFSNPASSAAAGSLGNGSEAHGLRVMSPQAAETLVSNNEFLGFSGSYRGLWVNNRNGVLIEDNLFTPDDGASEFTAVLVGNRELWNGTPAPVEMGVTLLRNTFNASAGGAQNNKAKAILFVNDNDAGETATAGALQVGDGTLVNANEFADGIGWYIALDDRTCNGQNHNSGTCNGTASYVIGEGIAYSGASSTSTQKRPFKWDVTAAGNNFAGVFSTDMDQAQYDALMAKTFADHNKVQQSATVGSVDYGWTAPVGPPQVTLTITNPFTGQPANDHKVGSLQAFGLAAVNSGSPGMIRGRLTVSRVDGASIPQQSVGDGSDDALDTMQVMTEWGPAELSRAGDGKSVSLLWPPFDVPLAEDADLDEQAVGVLFRVPGEYHVHAEIIDAADYSISYGDTALNYSVTQDLEVQITGTNPTVYNGGAQPLGFSVTPASNPAVADMAAKIDLAYNGALAAPINAGTYSVDATSNDDDYVIAAPATQGYVIEQAPATVQWGSLSFAYDGNSHTVSASAMPGDITCAVTPASIGPGIGEYPLSASCADANYSYSNVSAMASIGGTSAVHVQETGLNYASVADALDDPATEDGMTVQLAPGTYSGPIVLTKGVSLVGGVAFMDGHGLVLTAGPIAPPSTVIDGGHSAATGILVANGVQGATISGVEVTGFTQDCIFAQQGNDGLRVEESIVHDCGRHGIHVNGVAGIADVSIERNHVHDTGNRGIVVWNGFKQDITINDNLITGPIGATAIGFEDGTAAGVHITNNEIDHSLGGDTGIAIMQLTAGAASARGNLISNNTIADPGRHGIALMIPNGSGKDSGDGSIVVEGNTITGGTNPGGWADDDRAGIQVVRRYYAGAGQGQVDVTQGAVIRNNQVTDVVAISGQPAGVEGYGIVVEGLGSSVYDNILERNDVGLQIQQGNQPASLPGDSALGNPSDWFDRGNAPLTCVGLGDNVFADNTMHDTRFQQPAGSTDSMLGGVHNEDADTWHCSINAAIAAATVGDTLRAIAGTYVESVVVNKTVTLQGPKAGIAGFDPSRDGSGEAVVAGTVAIRALDVVLDGITVAGGSAPGVTQSNGDNFQLLNSRLLDFTNDAVAVSGSVDWQIRGNLFRNIGGHAVRPHGGISVGMVVDDNRFETIGAAVQMVSNERAQITNNIIDTTVAYAVQIANSSNVQMHDNVIRGADLGLLLDRNNADVVVSCNDIEGVTYGILAMNHVAPGTETMVILHNRVVAPHHLRTAWGPGETFVIGSNYYDGVEPVTSTPNGGELLVADALASDPIGAAACGDNTPTTLVVHSGTPQSAVVNNAFADPLQARITDALGGAVAGEMIDFAAPASGPGAVLSDVSMASDHNGIAAVTAEANGQVGTYTVEALSGTSTPVEFTLTNTQGTAVVTVTDVTVTYDGQPHAVAVSTDPAGLEVDAQVTYHDASNTVVATCDATDAACGPVSAGVYTATATLSGNPNYSGSGTGTLTIDHAVGTVEWLQTSFVYDGNLHTPTARIAEEPDTSCVVTGTVGPDAGNHPVDASCNGVNYVASEQGTAQVMPASATITLTHLRQAHDGAPKSVGVNTTPTGLPVTVTYDGSPTPPSAIGNYVVQADINDANYDGSAAAVLEIVPGASDIALVLNGPVDPIHVGDTAQYAATMLANPALHDGQTFGYRLTLSKSGGNHPLEEDDLATMQVFYQGMWVSAEDIFGTVPFVQQLDGTLLYLFPQGIPGYDNGFPIEDASWTWNFRFGFADTGTYTTTAELVDGISHAPIAPAVQASFATVVQDALPPTDIKLVLGGPAGEVRAGEFAEYSTTMLADPSLHIGETFFIKVMLNKSTGAMTAADLEQMQIHLGGSWVDGADLGVTFTEEGGNLVYLFPESQMPGGFPITSEEWSWNFRFAFAEAAIYTATAEVIHAFEAGIANPQVFASAAIATTVVDPLTPPAPQMNMLLLGPVDDVQLGAPAVYTGSLLANPDDFSGREFFIRVRLSKNGGTDAMTVADLAKMELHMGGWQDATDDLHPQLIVDGNELVYLFPQPFGAFQIDQQLWSWYFRFTYGDIGLYTALAEVIDAADADPLTATPLASTEESTNVVAQNADISLQLQGPVAGVHVGEPAVYQGTLHANPLPDPSRLFFVEVRLSKSTGAMQVSDLEKMELHHGGIWEDATGQLPFTQDGNDLVYLFPKPFLDDGFPIDEPVWSWKFRFTYADAATYTAIARVLDAADMGQVSAPAEVSTEVAPGLPNASIQINGPVAGVQVGQPTAYIGRLTNRGADLAENAFVKVGITHNDGPLVAGDVTTQVYFGGDWIEGTLVPDGSGGLEVDFPDSAGFPVSAGFDYTHQFRITYHKPGVFNAAAALVGADSGDIYALSEMATAVQPQDSNVSMQLNGPVAGVEVDQPVAYIGQLINHGPDLPENAFVKVGVTHDGGPLVAGDVTTEVYFGGDWIEGTLVPDGSGGLEVDFPDSDGFPVYAGFDYTHQFRITYHKPGVFNAAATLIGADSGDVYAASAMYTQVVPQSEVVAGIEIDPASLAVIYDGQPHSAVATTTPAGLSVTLSYNGNSSPPVDVGQYLVVATVSDGQFVGSTSAIMTISPAMATLTLSDTSHVYDGSTKAVTATSDPVGLAVDVTYDGSTTPPTDAGSYTVVATVTDANYSGSAVGQLVITRAAVTLMLSDTTHVYDGTAREVTVTTDPVGLAVDVTYDGSATAPTDAGSYAVLATVTGANYSGSAVGQLVIARAAVTLTLSDTTHVYDGTAREVTVTTDPVGLDVDVTYDGSATAPTDAGSYAVLATVTDANYSGSAVGQLVIGKAAVTLMLDDTTHVHDGTAKEVTVTTDPVGLAVDVTYDGSATPPSAIGSYAVVATVNDSNHEGQISGLMSIAAADATDLSVSISNDRDFVQYGKLMTWFIRVNNVGNTAVSGATVSSILPPELEDGLWSCMALGTATCTSDGAGDLLDTVNIPQGGGVLYILSARVVDDAGLSEVVNVEVNVSAAGDVEPANDSATDTIIVVLFRDGFQKGDGAQDVDGADENPHHALQGDAVLSLTVPHGLSAGRVSILAHGHGGGADFRVEAIATPAALHVRLVVARGGVETATPWSAVAAGDTLALGLLEPTGQLLLVGASDDLELSISSPND